jgi:hypothetical protein
MPTWSSGCRGTDPDGFRVAPRKYADVLLDPGLRLVPRHTVAIDAHLEHAPPVRAIPEGAYRSGDEELGVMVSTNLGETRVVGVAASATFTSSEPFFSPVMDNAENRWVAAYSCRSRLRLALRYAFKATTNPTIQATAAGQNSPMINANGRRSR